MVGESVTLLDRHLVEVARLDEGDEVLARLRVLRRGDGRLQRGRAVEGEQVGGVQEGLADRVGAVPGEALEIAAHPGYPQHEFGVVAEAGGAELLHGGALGALDQEDELDALLGCRVLAGAQHVGVGVQHDGPPERGPLGLVEPGALEELRGLEGGELVLVVLQPDLRYAAPQRVLRLGAEGDAGVDEVPLDLRDLARVLHGVDVDPVVLELLLGHAGFGVREDHLVDHGGLLRVARVRPCRPS
jgi:hypothetical protein